MEEIAQIKNLTLNATGAIGALACEHGLDWRAVPRHRRDGPRPSA